MASLAIQDVITTKEIMPGITDGIFKHSAILKALQEMCLKTWEGPTIQENFIYGRLNGGPFTSGDTFDISQKKIEDGLTWTPRKYQVSVSADLDKLKVEHAGKHAMYSFIDLRLQAAALTMAEGVAVALYRHGQNQGTDRTTQLNGLDEALSDGSTNGWEATTFASYGTITRANVSPALNSPMTGPAAAVAGALITYPIVTQAIASVTVGTETPNLIVTTNNGMSYLKMAMQAGQRFQNDGAAITAFGFKGISIDGVPCVIDNYAPGAAGSANLGLGQSNLASAGETLWILNIKPEHMGFWVCNDELMGFGFTGWKPAQDNLSAAGQYVYAGNFTIPGARYSRYLHTFTS